MVKPVSPYAPCAAGGPSNKCADRNLLRNPFYLGDQPGGTQVSGWLNAWTPRPSAYAVAARTSADVAAAIRFAREHRLRLAVKGGGHSYQGTSSAPDSLLIWTRAMREVELHDAFTPLGCEGKAAPVPAVSAGAGCIWMDLYDAVTTKAGRYVQGGGCTTVGVAGHVQSGGFGSFSKGFGLAAANLLEAEVVTADGEIRIANGRHNPDLFWALKGGGGGSFGVVTRLTLRTRDLPARFGYAAGEIAARSDAAFRRLIDRFLAFYAERLCNPHWGEQAALRPGNTLKISMNCQGLEDHQAAQAWRPFIDWVEASPEDYSFVQRLEVGTGVAQSWWDASARKKRGSKAMVWDDREGASVTDAWWEGDQEQVGAFLHGYESVWLPASLLRLEQRPDLTEALFAASRPIEVSLHFNKGLAGAAEEVLAAAADTATNPQALGAFALAIVAAGGPPPLLGVSGTKPDPQEARWNAEAVNRSAAELLKAAPARGSYVAESNFFNPIWREAFWGRNYPRLRRIKQAYDPDGLFIVHHGVGSEDWSPDGFKRLANA